MNRYRAPIKGGYVRTTITIPTDVDKSMRVYLKKKAGKTISAFITESIEKVLGIVREV